MKPAMIAALSLSALAPLSAPNRPFASAAPTAVEVDSYACRSCGTVLYRADEIVETRPLWELGDEKNEVHVLGSAVGLAGLRRYDASLHEGWYCCRFALMRMVVDKFGTGDHLLAYTADVKPVRAGTAPAPEGRPHRGQIWLGASDFDAVVESDQGDHLTVVKLGATWCPPCRQVDAAIARIDQNGALPGVRFYEADVDAHPELAERFDVRSLPTLRFWYRGAPLAVETERSASVGGALVGGVSERAMIEIASAVLERARAGARRILL